MNTSFNRPRNFILPTIPESSFQKLVNNKFFKIFLIVLFILILGVIGYYVYKDYIVKYKYTPDKINSPNDLEEGMSQQSNGKTVEFMLFYTTWCPHCRSCKPYWESVKEKYSNRLINGYKVEFVEIDCTNETSNVEELMNKYKVEGYPTIILVKDDSPINFDAQPSVESLEQFLNSVL